MDNERRKKLIETMKEFNKTYKNELLSFSIDAEETQTISTGIETIDKFIGGGFRKGTFTVIFGGESVGKSTMVLQSIANAQKQGMVCCYIDLEHTMDKARATNLGVNLDDLVLAEKCETAEQALEIIRKLCKDKVIDLVFVDSIQAMSPVNERENKGKERELASKEIAELARTLSKFFRVVAPDVFNAKVGVVMIGQIRIAGIGSFYTHADLSGGEALKHFAHTRVFMRKGKGSDAPVEKYKEYFVDPEGKVRFVTQKRDIGFNAVLKLQKTKSSKSVKENTEINIAFLYDKGFVDAVVESEDIPITVDITMNDEEINKVHTYLKENKPDEAKKLGLIEEEIIEVVEGEPIDPPQNVYEEIKEPQEEIKEVVEQPTPEKKRRGRPKKG